jgi:hypothetical protein
VPPHANLEDYVGHWELPGDGGFAIAEDADGRFALSILPHESVESVVNNVRWVGDDLAFDRYQYLLLDDDRLADEVKLTLIAKRTDHEDQLQVIIPQPDSDEPRSFTFVRSMAAN